MQSNNPFIALFLQRLTTQKKEALLFLAKHYTTHNMLFRVHTTSNDVKKPKEEENAKNPKEWECNKYYFRDSSDDHHYKVRECNPDEIRTLLDMREKLEEWHIENFSCWRSHNTKILKQYKCTTNGVPEYVNWGGRSFLLDTFPKMFIQMSKHNK